MRRKRRYDDYLSQESASPVATVAAEREPASSGQQSHMQLCHTGMIATALMSASV